MTTEDESDLKRKARWRLIGAVALALLAFVILPLLFDSAPKPLGNDVEISIAMAPQALPSANPSASSQEAEVVPAQPAPPVLAPVVPKPVKPDSVKPDSVKPEPSKPVEKPVEKPAAKPLPAKPAPKPEPASVAEAKDDDKLLGDSGYFLQLGVFGNEANARSLADKVRAMGYKVSVMPVGKMHRVRVVDFKGREQALDAKQMLKQNGIASDLYGSGTN